MIKNHSVHAVAVSNGKRCCTNTKSIISSSFTFMALFVSTLLISAPPAFEAFSQPPPSTFIPRHKQYLNHKGHDERTCNNNNPTQQCTSKSQIMQHKLQHLKTALFSTTTEASDTSTGSSVGSLRYKNRPIVLIGCSGRYEELPRLAEALVESLAVVPVSEEEAEDDEEYLGNDRGGVVELIHSDENGEFVFAPEDVSNLVLGSFDEDDLDGVEDGTPYITGQDVILLDYANHYFEHEDSDKLSAAYNDIIKTLYEELGCLCIYVNVHPEASEMEDVPKQIKEQLEESIFIPYTDYELALRDEGSDEKENEWENAKWELNRIVSRAYLPRPIPGEDGTYTLNSGATNSCNDAKLMIGGENTFFLSLSFPVISDLQPYIADLCKDNDSMEFRADLLACREDRHAILHSQFQLRSMCRPHATRAPVLPFGTKVLDDALPIVYTVRTANQAGTWPDQTEEDITKMFDLLRLGVRGAAEIMDVESAWDKDLTDSLLSDIEQKYSCLLLGSHHVVPDEVSSEEAVKLFQNCAMDGRAHAAKVVLSIKDQEKDHMALDAATIASELAKAQGKPIIPGISLILGEIGVKSRIINNCVTPVTHPALPFKAAPGQLSSEEIMEERIKTGLVSTKEYAILGHNIAYSVSPQMQGGAFKATGLPHTYGRADFDTVEEFIEGDLWNSDNFGGCSVTIPHKQNIMPYVDVMSDAANTIGAVNTITIAREGEDKKRVVYGDNTDWRGIYNPLQRRLSGRSSGGYALILGGGGTARAAAYAAQQLGLKRIYYNRTTQKAQDLVETFGGDVVTNLSLDEEDGCLGKLVAASDIQVVISTLPAAAEFELPSWVISGDSKPVIFDVNYKPYWTKLLHQAEDNGCDLVRGSEMLWEQGVGQFEIWTGRTAPYKVMKDVVLSNCLPKEE